LLVKVQYGRGGTSPLAKGKGCPVMGVWRKPEANPRPEEHELRVRLACLGESAECDETRGHQGAGE